MAAAGSRYLSRNWKADRQPGLRAPGLEEAAGSSDNEVMPCASSTVVSGLPEANEEEHLHASSENLPFRAGRRTAFGLRLAHRVCSVKPRGSGRNCPPATRSFRCHT